MADDNTTDTPDAAGSGNGEQRTPRRRGPGRKPAAAKSAGTAPAARKPRTATPSAQGAATRVATAVKDAVVETEERVVRAVKPRPTGRGAGRSTGGRPAAAKAPARATKSTRAAPAKRAGGRTSAPRGRGRKSTLDRATDAVGGRTVAAALGAIAAAGATVAAVLTLRGSSSRNLGTPKKPIDITGTGDKEAGHPTTVHGKDGHQHAGGNGAHGDDGNAKQD